jgi:Holliday junction resolvase RusA-like endonuclease
MTLTFETLPPTTNHLYVQSRSTGVRYMDPRARRAKEGIGWEARQQYRGKPLEGPLAVEVSLFWPDKRNRDIDNIKALLDACTGILWGDDGQITDLHLMKGVDREHPRVEMKVWPL